MLTSLLFMKEANSVCKGDADFTITEFSENDAILVSQWIYEGEYAIYNCPSWDKVKEQGWAMADSEKRKTQFRKIIDQSGSYIGYFRFFPYHEKIKIGLGMNPQYCGKHMGSQFVSLIIEYIKTIHNGIPIELEVRDFNERAIKCYTRCSFKTIAKRRKETPAGTDTFIVMEYHI